MKKTTQHTDQKMEDFLQKVKAHAISAVQTFLSGFGMGMLHFCLTFEQPLTQDIFLSAVAGTALAAWRGTQKILFEKYFPKK